MSSESIKSCRSNYSPQFGDVTFSQEKSPIAYAAERSFMKPMPEEVERYKTLCKEYQKKIQKYKKKCEMFNQKIEKVQPILKQFSTQYDTCQKELAICQDDNKRLKDELSSAVTKLKICTENRPYYSEQVKHDSSSAIKTQQDLQLMNYYKDELLQMKNQCQHQLGGLTIASPANLEAFQDITSLYSKLSTLDSAVSSIQNKTDNAIQCVKSFSQTSSIIVKAEYLQNIYAYFLQAKKQNDEYSQYAEFWRSSVTQYKSALELQDKVHSQQENEYLEEIDNCHERIKCIRKLVRNDNECEGVRELLRNLTENEEEIKRILTETDEKEIKLRSEIAELKEKCIDIYNDKEMFTQQFKSVKADYDNLHGSTQSQILQYQSKIAKLESTTDYYKQDNDKLKELSEKYEQLATRERERSIEIQSQKDLEIRRCKADANSLHKQIDKLNSILHQKEDSLSQQSQLMEKTQDCLKDAESRILALSTKHKSENEQYHSILEQLKKYQEKEIKWAEEKNKILEELIVLRQFHQQAKALEANSQQLQSDKKSLLAENISLKDQISMLTEKLEDETQQKESIKSVLKQEKSAWDQIQIADDKIMNIMKQKPSFTDIYQANGSKSLDQKHLEDLLQVKEKYIQQLEKQLTDLRKQLEESMKREMQAQQKLIHTYQISSEKKYKKANKEY